MPHYTITPWRNHSDLLQVRSHLYHSNGTQNPSQTQRQAAINRIMAWKLRSNLPHAIESTALLTDAILHHHHQQDSEGVGNNNSTFSIRAVYTAAFTRFVTGFCDIGRNKERTLEPSSMSDIAKQIGMPAEFVALRHEATHEEMPGMQRLVKVVDQALKWLWEVYWSKLDDSPNEESDTSSVSALKISAKKVLKDFKTQHREALRTRMRRSAADALVSQASQACTELIGKDRRRMRAIVEVLVSEKLLSPSKRELGASMDGAYLIWDPLLQGLAKTHKAFIDVLVQCLLEAIDDSTSGSSEQDVDKEALSMWLLHLLHTQEVANSLGEQEQHHLRDVVMGFCTIHQSHWYRLVGETVLERAEPDFKDQWEEIFEAGQGVAEDSDIQAVDPDAMEFVGIHGSGNEGPEVEIHEQTARPPWLRAAVPMSTPIGVI